MRPVLSRDSHRVHAPGGSCVLNASSFITQKLRGDPNVNNTKNVYEWMSKGVNQEWN